MLVMKTVNKVLCGAALGVGGLLGVVFLVDLIAGIPFGREIATDILVVIASGLLLWQGLETWFQL